MSSLIEGQKKFKLENRLSGVKFACGAAMLGFELMHGHILLRRKGLSVEIKITRLMVWKLTSRITCALVSGPFLNV